MTTTTLVALQDLFENNKEIVATENFSKRCFDATGRHIPIFVPLEEVESLYSQIDSSMTQMHKMRDFIDKGLSYVDGKRAEGRTTINLNAHTCQQLRNLLEEYEYQLPAWFPKTFYTDATSGPHRRSYFYIWGTVPLQYVNDKEFTGLEITLERIKSEKKTNRNPYRQLWKSQSTCLKSGH